MRLLHPLALCLCIALVGATGWPGLADAERAVRELRWADLMPEGEEERLVALYNEYIRSLIRQEQMSLSEAAPESDEDPAQAGGAGETMPDVFDIPEGSALDVMPQIGTFNTVAALHGEAVRLPGFIVPLTMEERETYTEFLLVPYFGACLHSPPPPPNQIVYVRADPAVKIDSIYDPVWVEGVMQTERHENDTGNAAYTIVLSNLELFEY